MQGAAIGDVVDVKETVAVLVRYASGPFQGHGLYWALFRRRLRPDPMDVFCQVSLAVPWSPVWRTFPL